MFDIRKRILKTPSYHLTGLYGLLRNAVLSYQIKHSLSDEGLKQYLGISKRKFKAILRGDYKVNLTIKELVNIALKVDAIPIFDMEEIKN